MIDDLINRLSTAETGSREMDREVHFATGAVKPPRPGFSVNVAPVTTSLDAALALAERLGLADWWQVSQGTHGADASVAGVNGGSSVCQANTPALALCIAILKARALKEPGDE